MPRITKKMKMEELQQSEIKLNQLTLFCLGYTVNSNGNILDEYGTRLVFGKENEKKFLKWGEGPFKKYKEIKYDPVNNYQLAVQLFSNCMEESIKDNIENDPDSANIKYIRTMCLRDEQMLEDGSIEKYLEIETDLGKIESERYICPTLAYIEIIFAQAGILPANEALLKRVDDLKHELEQ